MGKCQRVVALCDADLSKILAPRAKRIHVVLGDQREGCVGASRPIGVDRILRKARKAGERPAERVDVVGVGGNTGDQVGVSGLNRARGAARRDNAARTAERNVIEPARREPEMLGQTDGSIWAKREA
jgi:hypothetical protein